MLKDFLTKPVITGLDSFEAIAGACIAACLECESQHVAQNNRTMDTRCIQTCQDCADLCAITMAFAKRASPFTAVLARLCTKACYANALECEKNCNSDPAQKCKEACLQCAKECGLLEEKFIALFGKQSEKQHTNT